MSGPDPAIRRADLAMDAERAEEVLSTGHCGRLGTTGPDGWPYVVPLLYVWSDRTIYVHNSGAAGHLSRNIDADGRACFLVDEPGSVYGYGRFECDTALSYRSVMAFGRIERVSSRERKARFCDELMRKYGAGIAGRPAHVYPRLDHIAVFALRPERISGKEIRLPAAAGRWPATDRTRSPHVDVAEGHGRTASGDSG